MSTVNVLRAGLLTTVQDLGRTGHQHEGVPVGGAMDRFALRLANVLVGNDEGAAALEVTLLGPLLELHDDVLLSVTGANLFVTLDGRPLPLERAVHARAGARLAFNRPLAGCRAYVAFAGGIDVPTVLGSRATYVRAGIGGLAGRALAIGDVLPLGEPGERTRHLAARIPVGHVAHWGPSPHPAARIGQSIEVRALRGSHFQALTPNSQATLLLPKAEGAADPARDDADHAGRGDLSAAGRDANPTAGRGANPTAGRGANPTAGRGADLTAGRGVSPAADRGASPAAGRGANPTAGRGASPAAGRGASPAARGGSPGGPSFVVGGESDRMGYRLDGPTLELAEPLELVSQPVAFGTVQLPPGGQPIVLMADRQTTGGYPRVLEVASADLSLLAQAPPGTHVRFREVTLEEARRLYLAREQELSRLVLAMDLQVG